MDRICKICGKKRPLTDYQFYITTTGRRKQRWQCKFCRRDSALKRFRKKHGKICSCCGVSKQPIDFVLEHSLDHKAHGKICRECAFKKNLLLRKPKKQKVFRTRNQINKKYTLRYKETKEYLIRIFGNKCAECGKSFEWYAYDFHHKNAEEKEAKISRFARLTLKHILKLPEFQEEIKKCIMVCAICHRKIHIEGGRCEL